jgi:hypothetical protein
MGAHVIVECLIYKFHIVFYPENLVRRSTGLR